MHPYTKYMTIPFPLLDFIILTPFLQKDTSSTSGLFQFNLSDFKASKVFVAFLSAIVVGLL